MFSVSLKSVEVKEFAVRAEGFVVIGKDVVVS